jgi:hypothetical protein
LQDATGALQSLISEACKKLPPGDQSVSSIELEKGDYAVTELQLPPGGKILLFSKAHVRLLYIGKRNRPLFVLGENSVLIIREKIEIYYNTNNLQEVSRLMIRGAKTSRVDISEAVKLSLFSAKQQ